MDSDRLARAMARIEAAATRIEAAAAGEGAPEANSPPDLKARYEHLRSEAGAALADLDALIEGIAS